MPRPPRLHVPGGIYHVPDERTPIRLQRGDSIAP
jgi:hypothetical protein